MPAKALPLVIGKNQKILREKAKKVGVISKEIKKLFERMHVTVREASGLGLAAPQIGVSTRVIIAQISGTFLSMVNPEILSFSEEYEIKEEGCLSLPGEWGMVPRAREIMMKYLDERGKEHHLHLSGLNARVIQHEVDHLDGILFLDRIPEGTSYRKTQKEIDESEEDLSA